MFSAPRKDLHSALINCRSVVNKTQDIQLELVHNNLDLCILTETWIREDDTTTPGRLCPIATRQCLSLDMAEPVVVLPLSIRTTLTSTSQRASHLKQWNQPASVLTLVLKQLASLQYTDHRIPMHWSFAMNLPTYWSPKINSSNELILLGDFNIAVNKPSEAVPSIFLDMLNSFNLINRVDKPTQRLSNTLDLIIHDADSNVIPSIKIGRLFSDHNVVLFDISTPCTVTKSAVRLL